ncbi:MAG: transcription antitermination protein NusB [Rikenellaceae bacterium]|jgi:N utilization substance protein B|nr:transcription antitermination protein NusB [Rikenellaceae bacterium]
MLSRRLLRIKAVKALYAHFKSEAENLRASEKNLALSIDKVYQLYHLLLDLPLEVRRYAEDRIEIARNKKLPTAADLNPNMKFVENRAMQQIDNDEALGAYLQRNALSWKASPELIKHLYNKLVTTSFYKDYMAAGAHTYKAEVKLLEKFYTEVVADDEAVETALEEQSIFWADDLDFALIMVLRTLDGFKEKQDAVPLLPKYKNDDDKLFGEELFRKALVNYNDYLAYIEKFTHNWDVERIAFMDNLIMVTAMAELLGFESIPVKVTLDEYIELAKYYSTPGSGLFINGILDKIVEQLQSEGKLNKTGRGLL